MAGSIPTGGKLILLKLIYPSLRSNTKLTTLPTLCNYGKNSIGKLRSHRVISRVCPRRAHSVVAAYRSIIQLRLFVSESESQTR